MNDEKCKENILRKIKISIQRKNKNHGICLLLILKDNKRNVRGCECGVCVCESDGHIHSFTHGSVRGCFPLPEMRSRRKETFTALIIRKGKGVQELCFYSSTWGNKRFYYGRKGNRMFYLNDLTKECNKFWNKSDQKCRSFKIKSDFLGYSICTLHTLMRFLEVRASMLLKQVSLNYTFKVFLTNLTPFSDKYYKTNNFRFG